MSYDINFVEDGSRYLTAGYEPNLILGMDYES